MDPLSNNIGAFIKGKPGVAPQASSAGTVNGGWTDRLGYQSCLLFAQTGAASGSPSTQTLDCKLQSADDNSGTNAADIDGAAISQITAVNSNASASVDLLGAKRWIRAVSTVAFTGGTSPTLLHSAAIVLGGAQELPA
ncbi:MAG TPA: hypothetical protein VGM17_02300 [Rhizomicrobium sp.]|jgi:hypothetical protein